MNNLKIEIIGRGNVATHLNKALCDTFDINLVNPRTLENFRANSDICLISVSDNAIENIANQLSFFKGVIAHTSGSTPMTVFAKNFEKYGVFYPLQTFSKDILIDYSKIPVFIEASDNDTIDLLKFVASKFSTHIYDTDSNIRKQLHLASVFACNYVNHLYFIANKILQDNSLDINVLIPLIEETTRKIKTTSPEDAQTGPARRNDTKTINSHLDALSKYTDFKEIYDVMANNIIKTYHK